MCTSDQGKGAKGQTEGCFSNFGPVASTLCMYVLYVCMGLWLCVVANPNSNCAFLRSLAQQQLYNSTPNIDSLKSLVSSPCTVRRGRHGWQSLPHEVARKRQGLLHFRLGLVGRLQAVRRYLHLGGQKQWNRRPSRRLAPSTRGGGWAPSGPAYPSLPLGVLSRPEPPCVP